MDKIAVLNGFLILSVISCCHCQITLKATVNMVGISGDVTFTQTAVGQTTFVTFALTGVSGNVGWELRETWVDLTVEDKCSDGVIGPRYMNAIGGTLTSGTSATQIQPSQISDLRTLLGRSILLTKGNEKACGTLIEISDNYVTAFVRLQGKITGEIWFRQAGGERAEILTDLFDASQATTTSYNWKIYTGTETNCSTMTTVFNPAPTGAGACDVSNQAACVVGDLSGKHGPVTVGRVAGTSRMFMHDLNLLLSGGNTVLEKYLVLLDNTNKVTACGMIKEVVGKQAHAIMNRDGVRGSVRFEQKSPFDFTSVYLTIVGLKQAAGGYHVHLYPVPAQIETTDQLCSPDSVGGHWNPFLKDFPAPAGSVTMDQFEIGDLSGKYGSFVGKNDSIGSYQDSNLPLYGQYSIIGRSFVIHKNLANSPRWVCSNIDDIGGRVAAVATFKSRVIGTVMFSQTIDDPLSDTWVYGELNYADGTDMETAGHMWMVHENMVGMGDMGDACSSVGGMFNPFHAMMGGDYTTQCNPSNPLRCQVGDGTRQTAALSVRSSTKVAKKFFFTVRNMPLSGMGTIVGKSLVIHAANNGQAILACTNIYHMRTRYAVVDSWSYSVKGTFKFSQKLSGLNEPTQVKINVTDMNNLAGQYHVHLFPVPADNANPCSDASVSGHYNPYQVIVADSPAPKAGTGDKYEAGDLSGKNGLFENMNSYADNYIDNMLYLYGVRSIVGRSVVIHKMSDNSRWSCGTVREDVAETGGMMYKARADFKDSVLTGHALLTQYVYDGGMSDTTVYVYINYTDGRAKTMGHEISVGSKPVWGDRKSSSNRCSSTSGIFNPFKVNTQMGYDECSISNTLRCSVGDISGKQGTYDVGGGQMLVTDINLPLYGPNSVIGRSLVISSANGGSGNLACANIKPENAVSSVISQNSQSKNIQLDMAKKYAAALQTDPWNVVVFGDDKNTECGTYNVLFMGPEASNLKSRFENLVKNGDSSLGDFKQTTCTADKSKMSVLLLAVAFLCKKVVL